ncbi:unnamed protein product, partial [Didymodactylos carnosus]
MNSKLQDVIVKLKNYIHLALKTPPEQILSLLTQDGYNLPVPDLIISINTTGGIDYKRKADDNIHEKVIQALMTGLATAARTTNAWVTTAGLNRAKVQWVGEALTNDTYGVDVPCIGFCSWGYTAEPNHTHFLLFDDNTSDRKNVIEARTKIEQLFSTNLRPRDPTRAYYTNIPIVMILIGGDYWSFVALCKAINAGTPIVIVKRTEGLAAILTKVFKAFNLNEKLQDDNMKNVHGEDYKKIIKDLKSLSPTFNGQTGVDTQEANKILEDNIEMLRKNKNLIVIFDAHKGHHLEDAIADALLQSILKKQKQAIAQLDEKKFDLTKVEEIQWAMIWNKVEYARKHILTGEDEEFSLTQRYV